MSLTFKHRLPAFKGRRKHTFSFFLAIFRRPLKSDLRLLSDDDLEGQFRRYSLVFLEIRLLLVPRWCDSFYCFPLLLGRNPSCLSRTLVFDYLLSKEKKVVFLSVERRKERNRSERERRGRDIFNFVIKTKQQIFQSVREIRDQRREALAYPEEQKNKTRRNSSPKMSCYVVFINKRQRRRYKKKRDVR